MANSNVNLTVKPKRFLLVYYDFLVTHSNFMEFGDFSYNFSGINILEFFLQNSNWFLLVLSVSPVGIMNISLAILVVFESTRFRKNLYSLF